MAGGLPQLVYARLDVARFRSIYATRGRWALLDQLASLPAGRVAASQAPAVRTLKILDPGPGAAQGAARSTDVVSLGVLEDVVRRVAAAVLGPDAAGGARCPCVEGESACMRVNGQILCRKGWKGTRTCEFCSCSLPFSKPPADSQAQQGRA